GRYAAMAYPSFFGVIPAAQALWRLPLGSGWLLAGSACLTLVLAIVHLGILKKLDRDGARFLALVTAVYLAGIAAGSLLWSEFNLRERYFFFIYPYIAVVWGFGIGSLGAVWSRMAAGALLAINLLIFYRYNMSSYLWGDSVSFLA